ncbi:MAG: hypothetical protein ABFE13_24845 [Phycisphaerales bacterium]
MRRHGPDCVDYRAARAANARRRIAMRHAKGLDREIVERIIRQAEEAGMLVLPMRQGPGFVIVPQQEGEVHHKGTEDTEDGTADERG